MLIHRGDANVTLARISLGGLDFAFVESLSPERDAAGEIKAFSAQGRSPIDETVPLHDHGYGPFCRFRIGSSNDLVKAGGIYALVVGGSVRYIGVCKDLRTQFNNGFGKITRSACYKKGGQVTHCKVNRGVLAESRAGGRVDLYFYPTPEERRPLMKHQLVARYMPSWNGRSD